MTVPGDRARAVDFIGNFARQGKGRKNVSQKGKFFPERRWGRSTEAGVTTRTDLELIVRT